MAYNIDFNFNEDRLNGLTKADKKFCLELNDVINEKKTESRFDCWYIDTPAKSFITCMYAKRENIKGDFYFAYFLSIKRGDFKHVQFDLCSKKVKDSVVPSIRHKLNVVFNVFFTPTAFLRKHNGALFFETNDTPIEGDPFKFKLNNCNEYWFHYKEKNLLHPCRTYVSIASEL